MRFRNLPVYQIGRITYSGARLCLPASRVRLILKEGVPRGGISVSEKHKNSEKSGKARWMWPLGLMVTGLAGAAVTVLRGCWHQKMSWPIRAQEHSYQVCLGCGIKRLFDEQGFRSYGPYSYDLHRLMAWERARRAKFEREAQKATERSAS
jgi:hypothetical protein